MSMTLELVLGLAVLALVVTASAFILARRVAAPAGGERAEALGRQIERLVTDVARLAQTQERLRHDLQEGREDSLRGLADVAQGLQGRLAAAQRDLAEVKALEVARRRQLDRASDSLRRLETIVAGSGSRGAAGENILARALHQLPPDLLETNVPFGGRVVEYALRLPGGSLLPIDSKWTSAASLERLDATDDPVERRRLVEQVARDVRSRVREIVKYLDPERTLSLAVLAVPDAVHGAVPEAHGEGWRDGVLVVPYSLALPFVLTLYRLAVRFASVSDPDEGERRARLARIAESLRRLDETLEGRLSRALAQIANARDEMRAEIAGARGTAERLSLGATEKSAGPLAAFDPSPGPRVV
jgi:DNA recombination protein RmuC